MLLYAVRRALLHERWRRRHSSTTSTLATPAATAFASREETPSKPRLATSNRVFSASRLSETLKLSGAGGRHTPGPGKLGSSYLPNVCPRQLVSQRSAALQ